MIIARKDINVLDAGKCMAMKKMQRENLSAIKNAQMCTALNGQMEKALNGLPWLFNIKINYKK